jgi:hypothetical protein
MRGRVPRCDRYGTRVTLVVDAGDAMAVADPLVWVVGATSVRALIGLGFLLFLAGTSDAPRATPDGSVRSATTHDRWIVWTWEMFVLRRRAGFGEFVRSVQC